MRKKEKEVGEVMAVLDGMKEKMRLAKEQVEMLRHAGALVDPSNTHMAEEIPLRKTTHGRRNPTDSGKDIIVFLNQSRNSISGVGPRMSTASRDESVTDN